MSVEIQDLDVAFGGAAAPAGQPRDAGLTVGDLDAAFPGATNGSSFGGRALRAIRSVVAPVETALQEATPTALTQAPPSLPAPLGQTEVASTEPGIPTVLPEPAALPEALPVAGVEAGQPDLSVLTTPAPVGQPLVTGAKAGFQTASEGAKNVLEGLSKLTGLQAQPQGKNYLARQMLAARQVLIEGLLNIGMAPFIAMGAEGGEALQETAPDAAESSFATGGAAAFIREMLGAGPIERTPEAIAALHQPMTAREALEIAITLAVPFAAHKAAPRPRLEGPKALPAAPVEPVRAAEPQLPRREVQPTAPLTEVQPPAQPVIEEALQRAQTASQRAEAAVQKIEALPQRVATLPEGPPREVPSEILPAGRIAEVTPPVPTAPKEMLPSPRAEIPTEPLPAPVPPPELPPEAKPVAEARASGVAAAVPEAGPVPGIQPSGGRIPTTQRPIDTLQEQLSEIQQKLSQWRDQRKQVVQRIQGPEESSVTTEALRTTLAQIDGEINTLTRDEQNLSRIMARERVKTREAVADTVEARPVEPVAGTPVPAVAPLSEIAPDFGTQNVLFTKERAEAARQRIREKTGGTLTAGIDPTLLKDYAEIGGFYVEGGLREFGAWSERMIRDFGEAIRPYLQPVWDDIQKTKGVTVGEEPRGTAIISVEPPKAAVPPESARGQISEGPPPLTEPVLQLGRHKEVVDAAETLFREAGIARDKDRFPILSDQILEELKEGRLQLPAMQRALEAHNLSLADFGEQLFRPAIKNAAQRLQMLSVLQRRLNDLANQAGTREEAKALTDMAEQAELLRRETDESLTALSWWRRADNIRRGLLVTQFATAVRNAETQVGRVGLDVLDQAVQKVFGGQADPWKALETLADNLGQLRPTPGGTAQRKVSQAKVEAFLEAFPKEHDRLFGSYSSDIAQQAKDQGVVLKGADKAFTAAENVVNLLNVFNRFQEFATRRAVFWSEMEARLGRKGISAEELTKGERKLTPQEWDSIELEVKASVQKALEITFAQNPAYGTVGWHFVKMINQLPIILSGPIPFPRFMVNSLKFLYEFSPLGFAKLMTPAERAKWAAGDRQTVSRASIGTAMAVAAWLSREAQPDENKWYEYQVPGIGTTDIRAFNPFAAYAFVGELAKRARQGTLYKIESADIIRGIASANVRGGLGLFALDKMVQGLGELSKTGKLAEAAKTAGGELLSGLLVPLRTLTDLYAQFDPDLQIVRERRADPLLGPALSQFGVGEPLYLPTRAEPQKREQPALRQTTGLTVVSEKNALERELDRFQFDRREVQGPSTGDPAADNLIAKHMGRLAEQSVVPFVDSMEYQRHPDGERMNLLRKRLTMIRAQAKAFAQREEPELFKTIKEERVPARERLLRKEREERGLIPAGR